jgi:hypothetical protein
VPIGDVADLARRSGRPREAQERPDDEAGVQLALLDGEEIVVLPSPGK